ncbi:putative fatty acyl-CoA reductase CG5065 [Battus philenor]|uniref:putative fatty acyl-CoA reductase CG5065 n=1 Tax=Battus philenor TaxID=42288 RepID=UPI0035CFE53E
MEGGAILKKMPIKENSKETYRRIEDQYAGKSVFITGGTGFLGKVFVEKLLHSCPKIDKIFLLIRENDKFDAKSRIEQLLEFPIFQRMKKERPEDLKKVVPLKGDIGLHNLGLCEEDKKMLIEKVSYVFHFAANVKFNEPLIEAMNVNVEGTRRILHLCQLVKNIEAFVYISTAYSNTDQQVLEEVIYPSPASNDEIQKIMKHEIHNEKQIKKLLAGRPNTYTFAKALAEHLVNEERGDVPTVIIRPSIVSASYNDPIMGWVDNWFGATSLITTIATGLNRIMIAKKSNVVDLIPVDYVSNLTVVAAARCKRSDDLTIYNSCTSAANPLTIGDLFNLITEDYDKHNKGNAMKPSLILTQSEWLLTIYTVMMQIIPAFIADCWLRLMGKPPRFMKLQKRITLVRDSLRYFTSRTWAMRCDHTSELYASLSIPDRIQFPFDPAHIVWSKYIPIYLKGIREFLFKSK